jgi:hypothetical protein
MTTTQEVAQPRADERIAAVGPWRRLLVKPELGSLICALAILLAGGDELTDLAEELERPARA